MNQEFWNQAWLVVSQSSLANRAFKEEVIFQAKTLGESVLAKHDLEKVILDCQVLCLAYFVDNTVRVDCGADENTTRLKAVRHITEKSAEL